MAIFSARDQRLTLCVYRDNRYVILMTNCRFRISGRPARSLQIVVDHVEVAAGTVDEVVADAGADTAASASCTATGCGWSSRGDIA